MLDSRPLPCSRGYFSNKLKVEACAKGSAKHTRLFKLAVNYLYALRSLFAVNNVLNI